MSAPLRVWSLLYYLTEVEGLVWRQEDYTANRIIKVVKGEPIKGFFQVKIKGQNRRFEQSNVKDFTPALFNALAKKIQEAVNGDFSMVPIPGSSATVKDKTDFRTWSHAREIAKAVGQRATAVAALRWKKEKLQAHKGGSRDPQVHFENLSLVERPARQVVLFDDVMTTGSQMIGSYRRLAKEGLKPVCGLVVGRATKEQKSPVLGWQSEEIETEDVPIDWNALLNEPF
jgi:hypothetical protein